MARLMSWQKDARCNQYDPDMFFDTHVRTERRAKAICSRCDVQSKCLAFALESRIEFGVYGGLNGKERRAMWRTTEPTTVPELVSAV
ncbi:MAG: WhiB family transcriptional regulator [Actinomycetota bacterium]|nr:WhiB family transcriptional regulator [Actinomycetota bacterium]